MATAFVGKNDWLFLGDDTNGSVRQFTGEKIISKEGLDGWKKYFDDLIVLAESRGARLVYMVAPSKESIFPENYPYQMASVRPIDQFLALFPNVLYPLDAMRAGHAIMPTYPRTDTHWSDWGAYIGAQNIAGALGADPGICRVDPRSFIQITDFAGDLGNKFTPHKVGETVRDSSDTNKFRVFDSGIHNHGRIWVYENPGDVIPETWFLAGDSFSVQLARLFARWVRKLVYVHSISIDRRLIERFEPNAIIGEVAERFLPGAPESSATFDFRKTISRKLAEMAESGKDISALEGIQKTFWNDPE